MAPNLTKVMVNAGAFIYTVPNPQTGQPRLARSAHRGEIITVDAEEEARGRAILVNVDYPVGNTTVRAAEPALVDVGHDSAGAAVSAAKAARAKQLTAELAALDVDADAVPTLVVTDEDRQAAAELLEQAGAEADAILAAAQVEAERIKADTSIPPPPPPAPTAAPPAAPTPKASAKKPDAGIR